VSDFFSKTAIAVSAVLISGAAAASPLYDVFGPLPEATFGGPGIPNDEVVVGRQIEFGDTMLTVAMSATQRFSNPALTNDGAGTFFAQAGSNFGGSGESATEGALWNFNFYINVDGPSAALTDYDITLFYDFDTAFDNGPAGLGQINITSSILADPLFDPLNMTAQGSQNLSLSFLATDLPGFITSPAVAAFDANATGEYNFALQVGRDGWPIEQVRMDVQVVPVPAAVILFPSALAMLGWVRTRRRRR
jgi:hypothetical protein